MNVVTAEGWQEMLPFVCFGPKADMCAATSHVRFTPNSDRESGFPQTVMSALPPKADMCGALAHVRYGPIADIGNVIRAPRWLVQAVSVGPLCRVP